MPGIKSQVIEQIKRLRKIKKEKEEGKG